MKTELITRCRSTVPSGDMGNGEWKMEKGGRRVPAVSSHVWRHRPRPVSQFFILHFPFSISYRFVRQLVAAVVLGVVGVAFGPAPGDLVLAGEGQEFLPQFGILDRLLLLGPPAVALPADDPGGDAVLDVLAVGDHRHAAAAIEQAQPLDRRAQLHPVVGCGRIGPGEFAAVPAGEEDNAPAAGAGVAFTGTVGVDGDRGRVSSRFGALGLGVGNGAAGGGPWWWRARHE